MNRRNFLLAGGLIGTVSAFVAATRKASQPEGSVKICNGAHQPQQAYIDRPAFAMSQMGQNDERLQDTVRALVPCQKCGVLFALTIQKKP